MNFEESATILSYKKSGNLLNASRIYIYIYIYIYIISKDDELGMIQFKIYKTILINLQECSMYDNWYINL